LKRIRREFGQGRFSADPGKSLGYRPERSRHDPDVSRQSGTGSVRRRRPFRVDRCVADFTDVIWINTTSRERQFPF
jgi:hypothetical protein